jgi:hypothetical protein
MTPRRIALARHALGLTASCLVSYRNHFVAGPSNSPPIWTASTGTGPARALP